MTQGDEIAILHFNDVYHTSDADLVARFATVFSDPSYILDEGDILSENQLRIFSGDAFSPSLEASVLRGDHMTGLLNALNLDLGCYGNHDFDFGEGRLTELSEQTNFPWTLSNAVRNRDGSGKRLLAQSHEHVVREVNGYRIGFFGLAGTDWPSNCQHLPSCDILDPAAVARELASRLRGEHKCDFVIALTHMRLVEDVSVSLATTTGDGKVDLLLGGHDHDVVRRTETDDSTDPAVLQQGALNDGAAYSDFEGPVRIVKSGTDWRGLSVARLRVGRGVDGTAFISTVHVRQIEDLKRMPNYEKILPCPKTLQVIANTQDRIEKLVQKPLLYTDTPLEGRSSVIRSQECNLGNMLADAVRAFYGTDIALVNSGGVRCDRVIDPQNIPLRVRDLVDICPFDNPLVVRRVSGRNLATALENSVSDAHTDGRFLHMSNLRIVMDWRRPEGQRVLSIHYLGDAAPQRLDMERMYTVALSNFISSGFDGYACFLDAEILVDAEGAMTDTNLLLEVFGGGFSPRTGDEECDKTTAGIERARDAVVVRWSEDGRAVIGPRVEGRIHIEG